MSKDVLGNQLYVGDKVAYAESCSTRVGVARIKKLTPKGATLLISTDPKWGDTCVSRRSDQMVSIDAAGTVLAEVDQNE